jgi:hypothetical protein
MLAKGRVFGVCVVSTALLVAGCSSSGGKQSAPTTTSASTPTTQTSTPAHGLPPAFRPLPPVLHVVAKLGPCPKTPGIRLPDASFAQSARVKLAPIAVLAARVCIYADTPTRLVRSGRVSKPATAQLIADRMNRLHALAEGTTVNCAPPAGLEAYLVTFATNALQVDVIADGCGYATNGELGSLGAVQWLNELQRYTNPYPNGHGLRMGDATLVGPTYPSGPVSPAPTGASG